MHPNHSQINSFGMQQQAYNDFQAGSVGTSAVGQVAQSEVDGELSQLDRSITDLGNAVEMLCGRLGPITSQYAAGQQLKSSDKEMPKATPSCQVVGHISGLNERITAIAATVRAQINSLAV